MQLVEQRDPSIEIVRQALPQMSRHGIPITPANYAVWFEYLQSDNLELKGEMDVALKHGRISTEVIEDLYERYIDGGDPQLMERAREGLRSLVTSFRDKITRAGDQLSDYGTSLDAFAQELSSELPAEDLAAFIAALAKKTDTIVRQNAALHAEFESVSAEIGALNNQLEAPREGPATNERTGLMSRQAFAGAFEAIASKALDNDTHRPCLLLIDIDHFMDVSTAHGDAAGDRILCEVAGALGKCVDEHSVISHFGEDQFAVLLTDVRASSAPDVAEKLRSAVAALSIDSDGGDPIRVTCSMGVAWFRKDEALDDLIERADTVLFLSKEAGRNRVTIDD